MRRGRENVWGFLFEKERRVERRRVDIDLGGVLKIELRRGRSGVESKRELGAGWVGEG